MSFYFDFSLSSLALNLNASHFIYLLLFLLICSYLYVSCPRGIPPGPYGLPVFGFLLFLTNHAYLQFQRMGLKYGNIFSFYLGKELVVILNDYDAIKEAFVKNAEIFSGRPKHNGNTLNKVKYRSLVNSDGEHWKQQRRFALASLKDLGLGKASIERNIVNEICDFCQEIRKNEGKPRDIKNLLELSTANIICIMIFGKCYNYDSEFLISRKLTSNSVVEGTSLFSFSMFCTWINYIPGIRLMIKRHQLRSLLMNEKTVIDQTIARYKNPSVEALADNYIHMYLAEKRRREESTVHTDTIFNEDALQQNIFSLFSAGGGTIAQTVNFGLIYFMNFPEIQLKLQQEIDLKIGSERLPSYSDHPQTPFLTATIMEILRCTSLFPLGITHSNLKEVKICGYTIPKDSCIVPNLWNVHHDPKVWKNPDQFKPERFLSEANEIIKSEYLIPYFVGKRQCPGESMARMELYLYFAILLQKFTFTTPSGEKPPSMLPSPKDTVLLDPQLYEVCCIPRQ